MATKLPGALPRRPTPGALTIPPPSSPTITHRTPFTHTPHRHATIVRRPRRPYAFTQLVQLSDGSTYTQRTASPLALYRSVKDTRNHALWQPSDASLRNVEVDEAGKLAAFRGRFGRGWDAEATAGGGAGDEGEGEGGTAAPPAKEQKDQQKVEVEPEKKKGAGAKAEKKDAAASEKEEESWAQIPQPKSQQARKPQRSYDALSDLISGYSKAEDRNLPAAGPPRGGKKK